MKLLSVTISGADNQVPIDFINSMSNRYPWVEWGILFSETSAARDRYPSEQWVSDLCIAASDNENIRLAAHLCGETMREFMNPEPSGGPDNFIDHWKLHSEDFITVFKRIQINFDAQREGFGFEHVKKMLIFLDDISDHVDDTIPSFITQHNDANANIWHLVYRAKKEVSSSNPHHILHDCSRGTGISPENWPPPIAGIPTGYAGGIGPDNVEEVLLYLNQMIPFGYTWIDMESGVRDDFNRLDLKKVESVLATVERLSESRGWFEGMGFEPEASVAQSGFYDDDEEEEDFDIDELFD